MKSDIKIESIKMPELSRKSLVDMEIAGNIIKIQYQSSQCYRPKIKKLDSDRFLILSEDSGEIHYFDHGDTRLDNIDGLLKTFSRLRGIINANTMHPNRCKWITLTYSENMRDDKRIRLDMKSFHRDIHHLYGDYEYIAIREPQGRGAWHIHMIMVFTRAAPYISNDVCASAWGQGFVKVKKCENCDNLGAYLTSYMCDLPMEDAQNLGIDIAKYDIKECDIKGKIKRFVKGARMILYPKSMNYFTCSKGVLRPEKFRLPYEDAMKKVSDATLTFSRSIQISDSGETFKKLISTQYYNFARKNNQQISVKFSDDTSSMDGSQLYSLIHSKIK